MARRTNEPRRLDDPHCPHDLGLYMHHEPAMAHHQVHANQTTCYGLALVQDITEVWP
jgi:hypothetical protein